MKYGCVPDDPADYERDHKFKLAAPGEDLVLPNEHSLLDWLPPLMEQGPNGTCTVHGATAADRYNLLNNDLPDEPLSRAQLYWDAGIIEGNTADIGRQIRDVVKAMATTGVARESLWGYDKLGQQPPPEVVADALNHRIDEYQRVEVNRVSINTAIFVGHPVIIGIPVFKQFESDEAAATGIIRMPGPRETEIDWHCMLHAAYDPQWDTVMNSWPKWWGLPERKGFCKLPTEYIPKLGQDLWAIFRAVTQRAVA